MKHTIKIEKEVDFKEIVLKAGVRYWEDTEVNGEPDTLEGENIPCKHLSLWMPHIEIETGRIINWTQGVTAVVHYKVVDCCSWDLKDETGEVIISVENEYVPSSLCPKESGYGDYIIMDIDENGMIQDWDCDIEDFIIENDN